LENPFTLPVLYHRRSDPEYAGSASLGRGRLVVQHHIREGGRIVSVHGAVPPGVSDALDQGLVYEEDLAHVEDSDQSHDQNQRHQRRFDGGLPALTAACGGGVPRMPRFRDDARRKPAT
jgi:hypothetical protein